MVPILSSFIRCLPSKVSTIVARENEREKKRNGSDDERTNETGHEWLLGEQEFVPRSFSGPFPSSLPPSGSPSSTFKATKAVCRSGKKTEHELERQEELCLLSSIAGGAHRELDFSFACQ